MAIGMPHPAPTGSSRREALDRSSSVRKLRQLDFGAQLDLCHKVLEAGVESAGIRARPESLAQRREPIR